MQKKSIYFIVLISLMVALIHMIIGPDYQGWGRNFMRGYLIDILLPMNLYLLLQIALRKHFRVKASRWAGAVFPLVVGTGVELLQRSGYDILGNTYDPLDLVMYGFGVIFGVILDISIVERFEKSS